MGILYAAIGMTWVLAQPAPLAKKLDLISYLQAGYAGIKADLTSAAEAMFDADYGFKPTSMPEVRTFGETIAHGHRGQNELAWPT